MNRALLKSSLAAAAVSLLCGCAADRVCDKGACLREQGKVLKIGWGRRSLATDQPVPITGQFHLRVSQGVFTPVLVSALALENGEDSVIFVSADMASVPPPILDGVKKNLAAEIPGFPVDKLIVNATHTHAGPAGRSLAISYPNKVKFTPSEELRKFLVRQFTDAVKEAWNTRAPGSVAYGYGFAATGHSRRTLYLDDIGKRDAAASGIAINGHCKMYGKTDDDMFDGYEAGTDAFINLFYTFDCKGKLTGAVINVPCPAQTGEGAWMLHASFWHNVREKLAEKYGEVGVICQSAGAGDLSPRQLHYLEAEKRRYRLKYADKIAEYKKNPMKYPRMWVPTPEAAAKVLEYDIVEWMRAEDIANRIVAAFDEVLSWAGKEKISAPELKHEVRRVNLARRMFPAELVAEEEAKHKQVMKESFMTEGDEYEMLYHNSRLNSRRNRVGGVAERAAVQEKEPTIATDIHVVRIGDIAFASNRFELFIDYMHRIQARSPFVQTFIVQLSVDENGTGSYLATERAIKNKGYSASPYCNQVSPEGGQQLVNATLDLLREVRK